MTERYHCGRIWPVVCS